MCCRSKADINRRRLGNSVCLNYSARLHRRSLDRRRLGDCPCLIAIQLPTHPSDRLNVPAPVFPDNLPTALRVMPFPAPTECNVPSGSTCPLPPRTTIFPSIISATSEPVCRHLALVNVHAPSKLLLSSSGVARGISSRGEITAGPRGPSSGAAEYFRKLRSLPRIS